MTDEEVEYLARHLATFSQSDRSAVLRRLRSILLVGNRLGGGRPFKRYDIGTVLYSGIGLPVAVIRKWSSQMVRDSRELRPWQLGEEQYVLECEEITNEEFANEIHRREVGRVKDRRD